MASASEHPEGADSVATTAKGWKDDNGDVYIRVTDITRHMEIIEAAYRSYGNDEAADTIHRTREAFMPLVTC